MTTFEAVIPAIFDPVQSVFAFAEITGLECPNHLSHTGGITGRSMKYVKNYYEQAIIPCHTVDGDTPLRRWL
jgi:hypothetical protein